MDGDLSNNSTTSGRGACVSAQIAFERALDSGGPPLVGPAMTKCRGDGVATLLELLRAYRNSVDGRPGSTRWVDRLIEANPEWRAELLAGVRVLTTEHLIDATQSAKLADTAPPRMGAYTLLERLDQGGFADIFSATIPGSAKRYVVKRLRDSGPSRLDPGAALRHERNALKRLHVHPGLLRYEDWEPDPLCPAIVTEFVPGTTLHAERNRRQPTDEEVVASVSELCRAVQVAHEAGVSHRDITPKNVLRRAADSRLVLIDFGMAELRDVQSDDPEPELRRGATQAFAPPEVYSATTASLDGRLVDVYGLGAILFHQMVGSGPTQDDSGEETRLRSIEGRIDFAALNRSGYPTDLQLVCRRALALDPQQRFPTPAAMAAALDATRVGRRLATRTWLGRNAVTLAAAALATFFAAALMGNWAGVAGITRQVVIGGDGLIDAWLPRLAEEQGIDPNSITERSFRPAIVSPRRGDTPWDAEDDPNEVGGVRVEFDPRLTDLVGSLDFRIGNGPWKEMYGREEDSPSLYADIDRRDLERDGPLQLRLGGPGLLDGGAVIGPFTYPLSARQEIANDDLRVIEDWIASEADSPCFDPTTDGWSILYEYSDRYSAVVREFRFGVSPERLDHVAKPGMPSTGWKFHSDYPLPVDTDLQTAFSQESQDVQESSVLWVEIEFSNGRVQGPRKHTRTNRFRHDGRVETAQAVLDAVPPNHRMGRFRGDYFTLDALARVEGALREVRYGEEGSGRPLVAAVTRDAPNQSLRNTYLEESADRLLSVLCHREPWQMLPDSKLAIAVKDGLALTATPCPPTWRSVEFQGVFYDGSATEVYTVENEAPLPGFRTELIGVAPGGSPVDLYVVAAPADNPLHGAGKGVEGTLRTVLAWPIGAWAMLPSPATGVTLYADPQLSNELDSPPSGKFFAAYTDSQGQRVSACAYHADPQAHRRLEAMAVRMATPRDRDIQRNLTVAKPPSGWRSAPN